MTSEARPRTLGELKKSGYRVTSVKEELRRNLIQRIRQGQPMFDGIYGYEETVIPQLENAILSGQDIIFLGERGQAKSRIIRALTSLLDEAIPVIAGSEIHDNPFEPITHARPRPRRGGRRRRGDRLDSTATTATARSSPRRTSPSPTSSAKSTRSRSPRAATSSDELTIHYGLIPRTNRGIFCINELPDLAERIQVGLLNIMEERDVQIRGYRIRLPLDVFVVARANPEDYTNRGRIITPLKDRYGAQIRTHYPRQDRARDRHHGAGGTSSDDADFKVIVPAVHEGDRRRDHAGSRAAAPT